MTNQEFNDIVAKQLEYCTSLMCQKGVEYDSSTEDRLRSFKVAAELQGVSSKQALAGMMCKHTVSIYDMCKDGEYSIAKWEEKITDHINYLLLLKALIVEEDK